MNILTLIIHDLLYMLSPKSILVILSLILAAKSYSQNAAGDTLSFKLNDKAREMIDFGINFNDMELKEQEFTLEKYVDRSIEKMHDKRMTLMPYTCFTKWYEDPMAGIPMLSPVFYKHSKEISESNKAPSFGVGVVLEFSAEDVLRYIFWKSHRAKVRNRKNANAWKYYDDP